MAFTILIFRSPVAGLEGREIELTSEPLEVGREESCTVCLAGDPTASRHHARIEPSPEGPLLRDLGSANGVWVGSAKIDERRLRAGDEFRVGSTWFRVAAEVEAAPGRATSEVRELTALGEPVAIGGNRPFLLDDENALWIVDEGRVEIFEVGIVQGAPHGARSHFMTIDPGGALFGMEYGLDSGFLAVGRMGTRLRKATLDELRALAADEGGAEPVAELLESWVRGLSRSLTASILPGPQTDVVLEKTDGLRVESQQKLRSGLPVGWLGTRSAELLFVGMEPVELTADRLFPLTPESWAEITGDGVDLEVIDTREGVRRPELWSGLREFHRALCQCEFLNKRLERVDELRRLKSKTEYARAAGEAGVEALASVLGSREFEPPPSPDARTDHLLQAAQRVGNAMGIEVRLHPEAESRESLDEQLTVLARASRFRTRKVALREGWWRRDHGPLLGRWEKGGPVALLQRSPGFYDLFDPATGSRQPVDAATAGRLDGFGHSLYRAFPGLDLKIWELIRFGAHGLGRDFLWVGAMAIVLGLLSTVPPIFTGRVLDTAIPQAERGILLQFCAALVVVAFATGLFRLTQAVATMRIQGRMDLSVQAATWDRLLDLPATFFRQFSAGDLADRAYGVSAIRGLVAEAGVGAILGSLSSFFYLGLMAYYDPRLALVAVVATLVLVMVTTTANLLQLRLQREQMTVRGRITGLVHQLISGIAKIRVGGAERHAYRIWAESFSTQRRLAFESGSIQNHVSVFNSAFHLFSMIAVFAVMGLLEPGAEPTAQLTTGQFVAFLSAYGAFVGAMLSLSGSSMSLLLAVPIYERLRPILEEEPETDETRSYPGRLKGAIEISHVHFRYDQEGPWVLKDVSLEVSPGEFIALVGPSGSGKSTLLRLLLGFETPAKGSVYYDDQDLGTLDLREVRQQLGVVLQESRVLPADIYRNIVGSSSYTIDDAWEAATAAGFADDIKAMPMQMHTYVSEDGGGLSGGQRQRLLIARALVHKPRVLFFDEATSALDNRTQSIVVESMDRLNSTRIVIAHRLSTVMHADRIYYLEDGEILESGRYEELLALGKRFALLASRQVA